METPAILQAAYLAELAAFAGGLFFAGNLLLSSTRKKDEQYRWWGWVFYAGGFFCIALMLVLAIGFTTEGS